MADTTPESMLTVLHALLFQDFPGTSSLGTTLAKNAATIPHTQAYSKSVQERALNLLWHLPSVWEAPDEQQLRAVPSSGANPQIVCK